MSHTIRPLIEEAPPRRTVALVDPVDTSGVGLFADGELRRIELAHSEGLTSAQIVDLFMRRGLRLSEAAFRKYVQLDLLPRSRRVGRKGLHQGSRGLYPASTVRRLNAIKRMLADGLTIEEVRGALVQFREEIEALERGVLNLFRGFERQVRGAQFDSSRRKLILQELSVARQGADDLFRSLGALERALAAAPERAVTTDGTLRRKTAAQAVVGPDDDELV